jgi:hypothetical protein
VTDSVTGDTSQFIVNLDTCGGTAGPVTCDIVFSFFPSATGGASATVTLTQCATFVTACDDTIVGLGGVGTQKGATSPTATIDFGNVKLGTTKTVSESIAVPKDFQVQGVTSLGAPFHFFGGNCFLFNGPGKCKFSVDYSPLAVHGDGATLTFDVCPMPSGPPCEHPTYDLVGNGLTLFAPKPAPLKFGTVAVGKTKIIKTTITLDAGFKYDGGFGNGPSPVDNLFVDSAASTCVFLVTIGPGKCTIVVKWMPTTTGTLSENLGETEGNSAGVINNLASMSGVAVSA